MKNKIKLSLLIATIIVIVSCPNQLPNALSPIYIYYPSNVDITKTDNVIVTPDSAKHGDIITITGENFLSPENMQWEVDHPGVVDYSNHASLEGNLVLFNVSLEEFYMEHVTSRLFNVRGTKVTEFISFDQNKIVCKVPEGAKTGRVLVLGSKNDLIVAYDMDDKDEGFAETDVNPSEKEFTVLD